MKVTEAQMLLASAGYYRGAIDGDAGPKTMAAVEIIEKNASGLEPALSGWPHVHWPKWRRLIAAGQRILNAMGYEAGDEDGLVGHNTREALTEWMSSRFGNDATVDRWRLSSAPEPLNLPRQSECVEYYGQPGTSQITRSLTYVDLPFELRLDWDLAQTVTRVRVHEKAAPSLHKALVAVHDHYGMERMRDLGIDRYAGAYNPRRMRRMRGGASWSMHAYGCAIDFFAQPNALRLRCPDALFCKPQYTDFLDIMESYGWLPAIRLWGADAMHFQRARL